MGPLVLGTEYTDLLQVLREHRIDADSFTFDGRSHLPVPAIGTHLIFSQTSPRTLSIDVTDERLRFASSTGRLLWPACTVLRFALTGTVVPTGTTDLVPTGSPA